MVGVGVAVGVGVVVGVGVGVGVGVTVADTEAVGVAVGTTGNRTFALGSMVKAVMSDIAATTSSQLFPVTRRGADEPSADWITSVPTAPSAVDLTWTSKRRT